MTEAVATAATSVCFSTSWSPSRAARPTAVCDAQQGIAHVFRNGPFVVTPPALPAEWPQQACGSEVLPGSAAHRQGLTPPRPSARARAAATQRHPTDPRRVLLGDRLRMPRTTARPSGAARPVASTIVFSNERITDTELPLKQVPCRDGHWTARRPPNPGVLGLCRPFGRLERKTIAIHPTVAPILRGGRSLGPGETDGPRGQGI